MDDLTTIHNEDVVTNLAAKIEILFNQQNCDALAAERLQRTTDILDDRWLYCGIKYLYDLLSLTCSRMFRCPDHAHIQLLINIM